MAVSKEERTLVEGPAGKLEVAYTLAPEGKLSGRGYCAVVCHPHPLHGGTMDNKVVTTLVRAYRELGIPVARFNFRGAGASEGGHDDGVGEVDDLLAVMAWFGPLAGVDRIALAGFSFGTGVVSNVCGREPSVCHAVFVAPPVGRYNFAPVGGYPCPVCVVVGGRDELVDPEEVCRWAGQLKPPPELIRMPDASHFFHGQLVALRQRLLATLKDQLNGN